MWFKKFTSIHDRQALEMNTCLQRADLPEWMAKEKTTLLQMNPSKGNRHKQLQTYNLPTDNVERIKGKNKERD